MRLFTPIISVLATLAAAGLLFIGCGGGSSAPANGSVSVTLVDGPTTDYKAINLNVQSVQIHQSGTSDDSGWITVASPNKTIDLLTLQGGVVEALASNHTIGVGTYQMLRLVLGSGNTLILADGTSVPLTVPSGMQSGIKIPLTFTVQAGTTADVWIDFDGAHSIQVVATGSTSYILRPVVHGFMQVATGSVSGTLTGPAGLPLAGAEVMAQSIDAAGNASLLRTAITSATGTYTLNLLPINQTFYVVGQPVVGTAVYSAQASGAIILTTSQATTTANLTFTLALGVGGVAGTLSPIAATTQSDTIYLLQPVPTGLSGTANLMVASASTAVGTASETYAFLTIPVGSYQVQALRSTLNTDGTTTLTRSVNSPIFSVGSAVTTTQNLSF